MPNKFSQMNAGRQKLSCLKNKMNFTKQNVKIWKKNCQNSVQQPKIYKVKMSFFSNVCERQKIEQKKQRPE